MGWLTRNWHLKLAALGLAMILYTGFVYSGSFTDQIFPGLPVAAINQPSGAYPLTQQLGTVDVQYRLAADAPERVTADSFPGEQFSARVVHIADQAEFTPRNVQTESGRRTTVFAVKLAIANAGGVLKPGMPVDARIRWSPETPWGDGLEQTIP